MAGEDRGAVEGGDKTMPKVGDRYIIEIAEKYRVELTDGTSKIEDLPPRDLYRVRGIPDTFLSDDNFDKLDKYDSNNDNSYQRGLDDAWKALRAIADKDMTCETLDVLFGEHMITRIAMKYTAAEVIEKLAAYEAKKNTEEEEIKTGDEVFSKFDIDHTKGIVLLISGSRNTCKGEELYSVIDEGGFCFRAQRSDIVKTGRHFPEAEALSKILQGYVRNEQEEVNNSNETK